MLKIYLPAIAAVFILMFYLLGVVLVWLPGSNMLTLLSYMLQLLFFPIFVTLGLGQLIFVGWTRKKHANSRHILRASLIILLCQVIFCAFFANGYVLTA